MLTPAWAHKMPWKMGCEVATEIRSIDKNAQHAMKKKTSLLPLWVLASKNGISVISQDYLSLATSTLLVI